MLDQLERSALRRAAAAIDVAMGNEVTPLSPLAGEFTALARAMMMGEGKLLAARDALPAHLTKAHEVLKGVLGGQQLSDLGSYRDLSAAFIETLRTVSVFDRASGDFVPVPLRTKIVVESSGTSGGVPAEGAAAPITRMTIASPAIEPVRAEAICTVTNEVLRLAGARGNALLARALRGATAKETDATFLSLISNSSPSHASTGSSASQILGDLELLLDDVQLGAGSKPYLAASPTAVKGLALKLRATGNFPTLTVTGGDLAGVEVWPCDALSSTAILFDATGLACGDEGLEQMESTNATLEMANPASGSSLTPTGTSLVSMFQSDSRAIKLVRRFGATRFRPAVSVLTSVAW